MHASRAVIWTSLLAVLACSRSSEDEVGAPPPLDTTAIEQPADTTVEGEPDTSAAACCGEPDTAAIAEPHPVGDTLPQFPWPPPRPTSRYVIPFNLLPIGPNTTLGDVQDRLMAALDRGEIEERSVYARGVNGFALVARLETIGDDGTAMPGELRWQATPPPPDRFSLSEFFKRLFLAQPGRYRVIVFVVTGDAVVPRPEAPTPARMDSALSGGATMLTDYYRTLPAAKAHCEALIYEFFRPSTASRVRLVERSSISPVRHLAGAGIWTVKELSR